MRPIDDIASDASEPGFLPTLKSTIVASAGGCRARVGHLAAIALIRIINIMEHI